MSTINHLSDLATQVTEFVKSKLEVGYLTNPQLTEMILSDTSINKPHMELIAEEDKIFESSKKAEIKIQDVLKNNPEAIVVIKIKCGEETNLEGWFNTPSFNSDDLSEDCIADYHFGGNRHPVLNPVAYHEKIIDRMVYKARDVFNVEQAKIKAEASMNDSRIHTGALIKNITISTHKCSTLLIGRIITDSSGLPKCEVTIKKRGTRNQWTGTVCPSTILHAIIQRDKLEALSQPAPSNQTALFK